MTIRHHPSDEIILAYANGSLAATLALVVAAHLDVCAGCRKTLMLADAIGGQLLDSVTPVEMSADALSSVLDRLDAPTAPPKPAAPAATLDELTLSPAFQQYPIGTKRWLIPGIWARPILKGRQDDTRVFLLGAAEGSVVPEHGHGGIELTQVLKGEFADGDIVYAAGDFLEVGPERAHRLVVGANEDCVCAIGSQGVASGVAGLMMRIFT